MNCYFENCEEKTLDWNYPARDEKVNKYFSVRLEFQSGLCSFHLDLVQNILDSLRVVEFNEDDDSCRDYW